MFWGVKLRSSLCNYFESVSYCPLQASDSFNTFSYDGELSHKIKFYYLSTLIHLKKHSMRHEFIKHVCPKLGSMVGEVAMENFPPGTSV